MQQDLGMCDFQGGNWQRKIPMKSESERKLFSTDLDSNPTSVAPDSFTLDFDLLALRSISQTGRV